MGYTRRQMNTRWKARVILIFFFRMLPCWATEIRARLSDGDGRATLSGEGRVEFFFNGTWGGICFNDFMREDGGVVCRHLNFSGIKDFDFNFMYNYENHHDVEVSCYGHEEDLQNCRLSEVDLSFGYICDNSTLHITCHDDLAYVKGDRKVRLVEGDGSHGKVEFYSDGSWWTICGVDWGWLEGGVVCRELGFRGVASVSFRPESTVASGARFKCNGYELSVEECQTYEDADSLDSYQSIPHCDEPVEIACLRDIQFLLSPSHHILEAEVGENLTLTCEANNSKEVLWEHLSVLKEKKFRNTSVLQLQNISLTDQGSYVCVAEGLRGQTVRSQATKLVIPDYWQVLLDIESNSSAEIPAENISEILSIVKKQIQEDKYEVSISDRADVNFTVHLSKLMTDNNYDSIPYNINVTFEKVRNESMKRLNIQIFLTSMQPLSFCRNVTEDTDAGDIYFNGAKVNSTAESHDLCVASDVSRAYRKCSGDFLAPAFWEAVVLRNCFTHSKSSTNKSDELIQNYLEIIEESNITSENASAIAHDFTIITSHFDIEEKSINKVADTLEKIVNTNSPSVKLTQDVIEIINNVVNQSAQKDEKLNSTASSKFSTSLDKQLKTVMRNGSNFSVTTRNIVVESVQIEDINSPVNFIFLHNGSESESRVNQNISDIEQESVKVQVELPNSILNSNDCKAGDSRQDPVPVSFIIHRNGALFQDSQPKKKRNSLIVSILTLCAVSNLSDGSLISIQLSPSSEMDTNHSRWECVFWDDSLSRDEGESGSWSKQGWQNPGDTSRVASEDSGSSTMKSTVNQSIDFYNCSWNHLTSFSVLLDWEGDNSDKFLDVLSKVGCATSMVFLLVTIVSHLCIKRLRKNRPEQITIMLCSALFGLYFCFLIGINWTEPSMVCIIFGGLIHFFCLSSVTWMSVQATHLYLLLVRVFNAHVKYFVIKASVIAWGFPLVVVAVCIGVAWDDYHHDTYCFPTSYAFYIGVLGLVALLLVYNIVMYIIIVWNVSVTRANAMGSQVNTSDIVRGLQNASMISVLLGVSWLFGFLGIGKAKYMFDFLFVLFNSLQGLCVFLLFCLRRNEIREAWRDWFGIAICLKTKDDAGSVIGKPSISQAQSVVDEGETVSTSSHKTTNKLEQVQLEEFKNIESHAMKRISFEQSYQECKTRETVEYCQVQVKATSMIKETNDKDYNYEHNDPNSSDNSST